MTPQERIEVYQKRIDDFREDIAWLKESKFTINPGTALGESTNAQLIERQKQNIVMYERFIAKLREQVG